MKSHPLRVNGGEATGRTTEDSGCLAFRHTSTSKLIPNLTHNFGAQLPLVGWWPIFQLLPSSWGPHSLLAICEHQHVGGCCQAASVPAAAGQTFGRTWMERAPEQVSRRQPTDKLLLSDALLNQKIRNIRRKQQGSFSLSMSANVSRMIYWHVASESIKIQSKCTRVHL